MSAEFFGYYWFAGTHSFLTSHFACLDYNLAQDGKLPHRPLLLSVSL
jgi:hypothetical protein